MNKTLLIAAKEYGDMLKTKSFLFGVFVIPVLIIGLILWSSRIEKAATEPQRVRRIAVADYESRLLEGLRESVAAFNAVQPGRSIELQVLDAAAAAELQPLLDRVLRGELDGVLVLEPGAVAGQGECIFYTQDKIESMQFEDQLRGMLNQAAGEVRSRDRGLDPRMIAEIGAPLPLAHRNVRQPQASGGEGAMVVNMMLPFFFMFLMFMGVVAISQHMLMSIIEDKGSRVMELMLSAVSPGQFMTGKVVGLAGVGLSVIAIWVAAALGTAWWRGVSGVISPALALWFVIYYILGFLLFASLYAAIGAACNTLKEAQGYIIPVNMVMVIPMVGWLYFAQNPEGFWTTLISFIPPATPLVMMLRLAAQPDLALWQMAATLLLLAASVALVMWASVRIFRVGILMYGKAATPRELLRWLRQT